MAMRAVDPDSIFEPIEGALYIATTRARRAQTVKILKITPNNVIYLPVGKGTGGRERSCKVTREKFIRIHEPHPHTPHFAPTVQAEARATARARTRAYPQVATQEAAQPAATKEATVPVAAPAPERTVIREPIVADPPKAPPPPSRPAPGRPESPRERGKPGPKPGQNKRPNRYSAEQVREMYLMAVAIPEGTFRTKHQQEVATLYGCSETLIDQIVRGKTHAATTADLRLRHIRAAEVRLGLTTPVDTPAAASRPLAAPRPAVAEALPRAEDRPRAVAGQVVEAGGRAQVNVPRHGDGPPPGGPTNRETAATAATLLDDVSELIQTMARCIIRHRPLPSYLSMKQVEELAARCEGTAERLRERG